MTELEKRARLQMLRDSGPDDPTWDESTEEERHQYLMYAATERAYAHSLATRMAVREHGDGADVEDIDWYRDLVLHALTDLEDPAMI